MSRRETAALLVSAFAAVAFSFALRNTDLGQAPWFISRAAGLVTFALLSASVILGLLMSSKTSSLMSKALTYELHTFLSTLALWLVAIHVGALLFDSFVRFTPLQLLVPFSSPYQRFWTGLGGVAAWASIVLVASFAVRKRIGYANWRRLHYLSFGAYVIGLVHGIGNGPDAGLAVVFTMYLGSAATVASLLVYRISTAMAAQSPRTAAPASTAAPRRSRIQDRQLRGR